MSSNPDFDRWYAARKTRILVSPSHQLETFGSTLVNYHLISELDDIPGKIRIREGRLEAHQPLVITPRLFSELTTEGLGDEAKAYLEFLKETEEHLRILRYGYHLKSDNFSEQIVTDSLAAVTERVIAFCKESADHPLPETAESFCADHISFAETEMLSFVSVSATVLLGGMAARSASLAGFFESRNCAKPTSKPMGAQAVDVFCLKLT